ncbi:hypothetical protein CY34DRAFT_802332 [Suillus luteus UH-Slu-Lm8-n1]|uniref:Secreted protein n=1 Tax=Suillus luteus UH-Slu-Lm8-n1 TaxID=930992 RepID=A0A0D0BNF3_9AGAM|nr:hypothetical protein CY34DRAFT_802332 [Suillus luteus UH-Slu-Lm8-n1]
MRAFGILFLAGFRCCIQFRILPSASGIGFYKTSRGRPKKCLIKSFVKQCQSAVPTYTAEMIMKVPNLVIHLCLPK